MSHNCLYHATKSFPSYLIFILHTAVLNEVKALEQLHHPNIISYKHSWLERTKPADFGPDNIPTLFILTEYANSGNLHEFIFYNKNRYPSFLLSPLPSPLMQTTPLFASRKENMRASRASRQNRATLNPLVNTANARTFFLDNNMIWKFFTDVLSGLSHLHHSGIIHCDLKPQNLLMHKYVDSVTQEEITKILITDFGSVKSLLYKGSPRTGNTGTIAYMAPEGNSDLYCHVSSNVHELNSLCCQLLFNGQLLQLMKWGPICMITM